jgi:hypothetical protein
VLELPIFRAAGDTGRFITGYVTATFERQITGNQGKTYILGCLGRQHLEIL